MLMAMTSQQAKVTGRVFGWFIAVSLIIALVGGLIIGELTSLSLIIAILVAAVASAVLTVPLVWLLGRFSHKTK